jgi:hypothetical protein
VRPSTVRTTTPARSSTFRCFEIVGLETPKPRVTAPTVAGPRARRSTIPRRIGWATALNGSLAIWVTISHPDRSSTSTPSWPTPRQCPPSYSAAAWSCCSAHCWRPGPTRPQGPRRPSQGTTAIGPGPSVTGATGRAVGVVTLVSGTHARGPTDNKPATTKITIYGWSTDVERPVNVTVFAGGWRGVGRAAATPLAAVAG